MLQLYRPLPRLLRPLPAGQLAAAARRCRCAQRLLRRRVLLFRPRAYRRAAWQGCGRLACCYLMLSPTHNHQKQPAARPIAQPASFGCSPVGSSTSRLPAAAAAMRSAGAGHHATLTTGSLRSQVCMQRPVRTCKQD